MAISEWELWACANEMIRQHGSDASVHAAGQVWELTSRGDEAGARTWRLIGQRIEALGTLPPARH